VELEHCKNPYHSKDAIGNQSKESLEISAFAEVWWGLARGKHGLSTHQL
jgi:hypothetical protein